MVSPKMFVTVKLVMITGFLLKFHMVSVVRYVLAGMFTLNLAMTTFPLLQTSGTGNPAGMSEDASTDIDVASTGLSVRSL